MAPTSAEEAQAYINRAVGTVRFTVVMQAALPPAPASEPVAEAETAADVPPEVQPIAASSMPESDTPEGAKEGGVAAAGGAATQPPAGEPRRRASSHTEEVEAAAAAVRAAAEARAALFRRAESNAAPVTSALAIRRPSKCDCRRAG